jgi:hypothetical protein
MSGSVIQFQKGLSLSEFQRLYDTEEQCEAALERAAGPMDSAVHAAMERSMGSSMAGDLSGINAAAAAIRTPSRDRTVMQATKLTLTTWFLTVYLSGRPRPGSPHRTGDQTPPGRQVRHSLAVA